MVSVYQRQAFIEYLQECAEKLEMSSDPADLKEAVRLREIIENEERIRGPLSGELKLLAAIREAKVSQ